MPTRTATQRQETMAAAEKRFRQALATDPRMVTDYARRAANVAGAIRRAATAAGQPVGRTYSWFNRLSLESQRQRRKLTHLGVYAGSEQWTKAGRAVKDGAPALVISVPILVPDPLDPDRQKLVGFVHGDVYDYTDTVSQDPDFVEPDFEAPLLTGDPATFDALASTCPVPVIRRDLGSSLERSSFDGASIVVDASAPLGNQIAALAHQRLHLLTGDPAHPAVDVEREATVAAAQWLFMEMAGLADETDDDLTEVAVAGLSRWVDPRTADPVAGHKARVKLLSTRLDAALELAGRLLDAIA